MLKNFLILVALFSAHLIAAQQSDTTSKDEKVYEIFDITALPMFPGGEMAMQKYLGESINYPEDARKNNKGGTVALSFVIEKDGKISNIKIVKSVSASIDQEATRVIAGMPIWSPGQKDGVPVRVKFMLPIRFRLE